MIRLSAPGTLEHRDVALRVVGAACRLVGDRRRGKTAASMHKFREEVISACGEAWNNVALHGYAGRTPDDVELRLEPDPDGITIEIRDHGTSFDLSTVAAPDFDSIPESGYGVFIIRSFMDEVCYEAGPVNVLRLRKSLR